MLNFVKDNSIFNMRHCRQCCCFCLVTIIYKGSLKLLLFNHFITAIIYNQNASIFFLIKNMFIRICRLKFI